MALIQTATFTSPVAGETSIICAYPGNVTKGHLLLMAFSDGGGGVLAIPPSSITDTQGNTWAKACFQNDAQSSASIECFFAVAKATGACTVTVDFAGNTLFPCAILAEFSDSQTALDQGTTNGSTQIGGATTPAAITTTKTALMIAVSATGQGNGIASINSGYTIAAQVQNPNGLDSIMLGFLENAAPAVYQPTITWVNFFSPEAAQASFIAGVVPGVGSELLTPPLPRKLPWLSGKPRLTDGKNFKVK